MKCRNRTFPTRRVLVASIFVTALLLVPAGNPYGADLQDIQKQGVLRHLGIPYANFVTGNGDGLEVELVRLFAQHIGVRYEFVETSWGSVIADLTGKVVKPKGDDIEITGEAPVKGDIVATGFSIIPWREKIVKFSTPTFPTQVWLVTRADSPLEPIQPVGDIEQDIAAVQALLRGECVLGKPSTCLDPPAYRMEETRFLVKLFQGSPNERVPAVIAGEADYTVLEVPDTLVALKKWPGRIKIIGPLSPVKMMGYAFAKSSPQLRDAFNRFFDQCMRDGTYRQLVQKYYPAIFQYYPEFFQAKS
ncbi:MAG: transporter substrate-binding domain-containing protein [Syntrophobacteraceae bacterium]|jgi:ABC-type amino acid transport substrate-binding protein